MAATISTIDNIGLHKKRADLLAFKIHAFKKINEASKIVEKSTTADATTYLNSAIRLFMDIPYLHNCIMKEDDPCKVLSLHNKAKKIYIAIVENTNKIKKMC